MMKDYLSPDPTPDGGTSDYSQDLGVQGDYAVLGGDSDLLSISWGL